MTGRHIRNRFTATECVSLSNPGANTETNGLAANSKIPIKAMEITATTEINPFI